MARARSSWAPTCPSPRSARWGGYCIAQALVLCPLGRYEQQPVGMQPVDDRWALPALSSPLDPARAQVLLHEAQYLEALPSAQMYEKSYMHRDTVTQVATTPTDFFITGGRLAACS